uniref:Rho-GAP domain-containing protein n=1 Tax=Accipiter nisus TaxID=211598 RepID=A0A8B9RVV8_9AVES
KASKQHGKKQGSLLAVFGQRLAETMAYEQKFGQHQVPILVQKCAEFIREHGVSEEGIFRLPGQDNLVKQKLRLSRRA